MNTSLSFKLEKMIRPSSFVACLIFLAAHIIYLVFFAIIDVRILVYINIASAIFYSIMLILVKYKFYNTFVILTALEIAAYMTGSTIIVGIEAGFNLCLIALGTLVFFAGYFSRFYKNRIKPVAFSILYMALFTFTYVWGKYNQPYKEIADLYETILFIAHIIIVFAFSTTYLAILTRYTVKLEKQVLQESETDKLTNIPNRKGLSEYFSRLGDQKSNYIIAIFDIDNFKIFNDKNGHICGDYVLKEIARIASDNSVDDFVSRWGGEEFVIIAKKDENIDETYKRLDNIREKIQDYDFNYNNKHLKSTITIGVALYEENQSLDDWILKADKKLYEGKKNGKNQMVI